MKKIKNVEKKQSFLHGALVLMVATALVKVIGAIFKIPLGNIIGETGMGYYQTAYDLYLPIYSLAMAGLPVAVSRMVAESVGAKRFKDTRKILSISRKAFLVTGLVGFFVILVAAYPYVMFVNSNSKALAGILCIAPSILFCCVMSSFRGYYEGLRNMRPTAVSQVIEAFVKLIFGLSAAYVLKILGFAVEYQAATAIFAIMLGSFFGALYLFIFNKKTDDGITEEDMFLSPDAQEGRVLLRQLIAIAIPVVLGSLVVNIASLIDVTTVQRRLTDVVMSSKETLINMYPGMFESLLKSNGGEYSEAVSEIPTFLYGCYKGYAFSVYNLVPTITSVLGVSALPAVAAMWSAKDTKGLKINIESAVRVSALISMPCGIGIIVLSDQIMHLLYPGKAGASISGPILLVLGIAAVFSGIAMPLTNMLQAIGKQKIPLYNIFTGAVLKIIINYALVGIPEINVKGAPVGTAVCYAYICIMNYIFLIKYSKIKINFFKTIVKPLFAALLCGASAWLGYYAASLKFSVTVSTVFAVVLAVIIFMISVLLFKILTKEDILMLPKGEKMLKVLEKTGMIG